MGRRSGTAVADKVRDGLEQSSVLNFTAADATKRAGELAARTQEAAGPMLRSAADALTAAAHRGAEFAAAAEKAAEPVVISAAASAAGTLSDAAERAAGVLAETAGRLTQASTEPGIRSLDAPRERLAELLAQTADRVRPRRRSRVRLLLLLAGAAGGTAIVIRSGIIQKLRRATGSTAAPGGAAPITLPERDLPRDDEGMIAGELSGAAAGVNGGQPVGAHSAPPAAS